MVFVKGDPNINRDGRPKGSKKEKSFIEFYDEICQELAKENKMDVEDVKRIIYKVGYKQAKNGNYQFYKDILDRTHGQATQKHEVKAEMEIILGEKEKEKLDKLLNEPQENN